MPTRKMHDPGEDEAAPKGSRIPAPPGRFGADEGLRVNVRGDGPEIAAEVQYHIRAQTGTTAGAGKRIKGLGTTFGLPLDEPQHGELSDAESESIEGGNIAIQPRRKLAATE